MDPNNNLYAQFLVADGILSCDRIMRIARFCMDAHLAAENAKNLAAPEWEEACVLAD